MMKRFKPDLINLMVPGVFLLIVGLIAFIYWSFSAGSFTTTSTVSYILSDTTVNQTGLPDLSDTTLMTYARFRDLEETRKQEQDYQKMKNAGTMGNSLFSALLGFTSISECDTCRSFAYSPTQTPQTTRYYLMLPGYQLTDEQSEFSVKQGKYLLKYVVWDQVTDKNGHSGKSGHYEQKELPFRLSYDPKIPSYPKKLTVLIPLSKKVYQRLYTPFVVLLILTMLCFFYICFAIPAKILLRISRGEIFTQKHVRQLYLVMWTLLGMPFLVILLQWLIRLIFYRTLAGYVQSSISIIDILSDYKISLLAGLVFFAIAKAFKKGLSLQHEQDLTV